MGDILSHAEVEAILSAIKPADLRIAPVKPEANSEVTREWQTFHFQPEPLQGRPLQFVQALHAGLCREWTTRFSTLWQSEVTIRAVGACRTSSEEFVEQLTAPSIVCRFKDASTTHEMQWIWSVNFLFSLFARMLGGQDEHEQESARAMTSIERRMLSRLNDALLVDLNKLLKSKLTILEVVEEIRPSTAAAARFPVIWFSFEIQAKDARGIFHISLPAASMNQAIDQPAVEARSQFDAQSIPKGVQQVTVAISANLAQVRMRASDVAGLQIGDVIMTDLAPNDSISLSLGNVPFCNAVVGTHLGYKALRLTPASDPPR